MIKCVKSMFVESLRFPAQCLLAQGESAPKARPKGVVDGKLVNIPILLCNAMRGRRRLKIGRASCRERVCLYV